MKAYKVITKNHTSVYSNFKHTYKVKRWTTGIAGTGLLCYKKLHDATRFNNILACGEVWEVEVRGKIKLPLYRIDIANLRYEYFDRLKDLWHNKPRLIDQFPYIRGWPQGTVAYKEVKLIRRVA